MFELTKEIMERPAFQRVIKGLEEELIQYKTLEEALDRIDLGNTYWELRRIEPVIKQNY